MEHKKTSIEEFLNLEGQIIDVRSPKEFEQGHIPGAWNLPLFTDGERAQVGIAYKLQGSSKAVEVGLKFVGPKLSDWVRQIRKRKASKVKVYCARGGMRSQSLLWLLNFCRIPATSLLRGYKNYRNWVLNSFNHPYLFRCLGGYTGTGKSEWLAVLQKEQQVLDLEKAANHRGSLFGSTKTSQPTCEQFENRIAEALFQMDPNKPIWVEDESRLIGRCCIPNPIYNLMRAAPLYFLQIDSEKRVQNIMQEYGQEKEEKLVSAVTLLKKRLGLKETREIIHSIESGEIKDAATRLLKYYDKTYAYSLKKRTGPLIPIQKEELIHSSF